MTCLLRIEKVADVSPVTGEPDCLGYDWIEVYDFSIQFSRFSWMNSALPQAERPIPEAWVSCRVRNERTESRGGGHHGCAWDDIYASIKSGCYKIVVNNMPDGNSVLMKTPSPAALDVIAAGPDAETAGRTEPPR